MVQIRKVGSNGFGFLKRTINDRRHARANKAYAENYRKAFNIQETHQEKLVKERKEQQKKKFAERKRIIARLIGLNNKRKRIYRHKKKNAVRYKTKTVTRYRYI